ncbi:hypothetical protein Aperf_G00000100660 [Anoplocephala perfoliata]
MSELECSFKAFCDSTEKGSTTCDSRTLQKICRDCGIFNDKLDQVRVDIQFRKQTGNVKTYVDFNSFLEFIKGPLSKAYAKAYKMDRMKAIEEIKFKIANGTPQYNNVTEAEWDEGLVLLCDHRLYTGASRNRFDPETGRGMGSMEEKNIVGLSGYVNGYKNMGTYDKIHPPSRRRK